MQGNQNFSSMLKRLSLISFVLLYSLVGFSQLNVNLLSNYTYPASRGDLNDVWGYVDGTGKEYALVGLQDGVAIMDISTPASPVEVFYTSGANSIWRDIKVWQDVAYITNESSGGLMIIDMSSLPGTITAGDVYSYSGSTYPFTKAHDFYVDENGVGYVIGADNGVGGAIFLDLVTDPLNPTELGRYNDYYLHDAMVRGDTVWGGAVNDGFLAVIDVTDKNNPVTMATQITPNAFTHNAWPSDDGQYVFTTDEKSNAYIAAYDVSSLSNITEVDKIQSSPGQGVIPHNTFYYDGYLVTSYYTDGITIHDVSDPTNMVEVGNYDTSPSFSGNGFNGCWGVYPYLPSGLILATDIEEGLFILGPTYVRASNLQGNVTDAATTNSLDGVQIDILTTTISTNTNILGDYLTGIATAGTYDVTYAKFGYISQTITGILLTSGNVTTQNVALVPIVSFTMQGTVIDASNSNPIANARVKISNTLFSTTVLTDVSGNFSIPNFIEDNYDVTIGKWGYEIYCATNQLINQANNPYQYSLSAGYYDDFSLDLGWVVTGTASVGDWERGIPLGTTFNSGQANPGNDVSTDCGEEAYVTGNSGTSSGDDDIDGGEVILTSPMFDLTSYLDPNVNFSRWFFNAGGFGNPNDSLVITLTNGLITTDIDFADVNDPDVSTWSAKSIRVLDLMPLTANMQLTVRSMDISPGHLTEAGFDKFEVVEMGSTGVIDVVANKTLIIYPNPFGNELNIRVNSELKTLKIQVYEVTGKLIDEQIAKNTSSIRFTNNYKKGIYFVNVYGDGVLITTEKLIKF